MICCRDCTVTAVVCISWRRARNGTRFSSENVSAIDTDLDDAALFSIRSSSSFSCVTLNILPAKHQYKLLVDDEW